jgi:hypothetical protein
MEGFAPITDYRSRPLAPKFNMDFGAADRLSVFTGQYQFFTPSLFYLFGHFSDVHLLDFLREVNREVPLMFHVFNLPIFAGMNDNNGDPGWNHTLWAVNKADWEELENFILSAAIFDNVKHRVYRTGTQQVNVVDPLWMDLNRVVHARAPRLDVTVFGVDCNAGCVAMDVRYDPPVAVRFPPQKRTQEFARLILDREDPVAAQAQFEERLPDPPKTPVDFKLRSFDDLSPDKQREVANLIRRYKQEFS